MVLEDPEAYGGAMPGPLLTFVDDNEADHLLIQDALGSLDYPVRSQHFVHVREFLAALDSGDLSQDAVITDLNMPGPSGFDLVRALKERTAGRLPVLIFSTSPADADRSRAAALEVDGYFVKPVSYAGLVEQLHDMVVLVRRCQGSLNANPSTRLGGDTPLVPGPALLH